MTLELSGPFLHEQAVRWSLRGMRRQGPVSLSGRTQRARLDGGGYWEAELNGLRVFTADDIRTMRKFELMLDQGVTDVIVPACESRTAPWPIVSGKPLTVFGQLPHSDETLFSDDTGYAEAVIKATVAAAAAFRATTILIDIDAGSALQGGEVFSIEHPNANHRRYQIGTIEPQASGAWLARIGPPLRQAVPAGTVLNFDNPKCLMRLLEANGMDLLLSVRKFGKPTVTFEESDF